MEVEFLDLLTEHAPIAALVGNRIYWSFYPQGAEDPCIRLTVIDGDPDRHMQGPSGLQFDLVQLDIRALTPASAIAVRNAVVTRLDAKRLTQGGVKFVTFLRGRRGPKAEKPGTTLYHSIQLDFDIWSGVAA